MNTTQYTGTTLTREARAAVRDNAKAAGIRARYKGYTLIVHERGITLQAHALALPDPSKGQGSTPYPFDVAIAL